MADLPSFETYGNYSSDNYGAHALVFQTPQGLFWFSYRTLVAFTAGDRRVVRENDWGPTTGKHLNWIDGGNKAARVSSAEFERLYDAKWKAIQAAMIAKVADSFDNARLIAAAPDLLEALQRALTSWDDSDGRTIPALVADEMRAAIAKANG